jgi:hypothetical protein
MRQIGTLTHVRLARTCVSRGCGASVQSAKSALGTRSRMAVPAGSFGSCQTISISAALPFASLVEEDPRENKLVHFVGANQGLEIL